MFSIFAGETLFYRYDTTTGKDGDLLPGRIIKKSERIDQPIQRTAGVFMTTRLVAYAAPIRAASS